MKSEKDPFKSQAGGHLPPLNVAIVYEDRACGVRARHFAERLGERFGRPCQLANSLWRVDLLHCPAVATEAAVSTADCDYLVVSLRGDRPLADSALEWIAAQLDRGASHGMGMIALFDWAGQRWRAREGARHHLRSLCADKGVAFFSHAAELADDGACLESRIGSGPVRVPRGTWSDRLSLA